MTLPQWVKRGLSIAIPLLILCGVLAAIAVPNLITAIGRSKQKKTLAIVRTLGTAVEEYAISHKQYPAPQSITSLVNLLQSEGIDEGLESVDGWGNPIAYFTLGEQTTTGSASYYLIAPGKDGIFEHSRIDDYAEGPIYKFNQDVIFRAGKFYTYPSGL